MAIEKSKPGRKSKVDLELKRLLENKKARIIVIGVGGAGNNTLTRMKEIGINGSKFIAINTDAQDLLYADADEKLLIGKELTEGLGAGGDPAIGEQAAIESKKEIENLLKGNHMAFITCGLGGGTGTGAAPVITRIAKKLGLLTVAVVTTPFEMEGTRRINNSEEGLKKLLGAADTIMTIPNDKLLYLLPDLSINTAFKMADDLLVNAVKGITELITKPGLINLDFADVRTVMKNKGLALIGIGESNNTDRAMESVEKALNNPFINYEIDGADSAIVNVSGADVTIEEANKIVETVATRLSPDARIIWGAQIDNSLKDAVRTLVIMTGVNGITKENSLNSK
jgi:cell division protein FtsZ